MSEEQLQQLVQDPDFLYLKHGVLYYLSLNRRQYQTFFDWLLADGVGAEPMVRTVAATVVPDRKEALDRLRNVYIGLDDETWRRWLDHKAHETDLLAAVQTAQTTGDIALLTLLNNQLYGPVDTNLLFGCLELMFAKMDELQRDPDVQQTLYADLDRTSIKGEALTHVPSPESFRHYQTLLADYFNEPLAELDHMLDHEGGAIEGAVVQGLLQTILRSYGADARGWRAVLSPRVDRVSISAATATIQVADRPFYLSPGRLKGLLLHEVGVHVLRRLHKSGFAAMVPAFTHEERMTEEGIGVLVEQLVLREYHSLRIFRYIAVGLATGVPGPRSALEVYQILWKLRYLSSGSPIEQAKRFAAQETIRVFRGIAPQVPGTVLLRDTAYLEGNDRLWRMLNARQLAADEFYELLRSGTVQ